MENNLTDIPVSENKGSSGGQMSPKDGHEIIEKPPFQDMSQVVQGLAANKSKSFGGEIGASLLAGSFTQMANDLESKNIEIKEIRVSLENKYEELHKWKQRASVLEERVNANGKIRTLGNIAITLGTALVGISIELYRNALTAPSFVVAAIGVSLIMLGWFTGIGGKK